MFPPGEGCEVSAKCVDCSLSACKYEAAVWYRRLLGAIAIQVTTMREIDAGRASQLEALLERRFPRRHDG